jgi:hypothetical protein
VVDVELQDDETVLLHLDTKAYFSLNLTGARIWEALKVGQSLGEISELPQEQFDVDAQRAEKSVVDLVETLSQHGLVEIVD